ncbi:uncharacterized protein LOC124280019 [Haliotis rubra]|uniref:uncharacterized protein LOC124280019 n=1 Tax=Haliotis rubra TaxID=36100 RepID=UPI001EE56834|nr:uncharacterized protein LOC124280019 [Haliotis rubra]
MAAASQMFLLSLFMLLTFRYGDTKTPLISVIEALEKLVLFYKNSYQDFNVDGLFGLRVVEGQVQLLLNEYNQGQHQHISPDVLERLRHLVREATQVSNQALEYVRKDDETYYNNFKFIVGTPWSIYRKHRGIDPKLKWLPEVYKAQKNANLDEEVSDQCMGELTGASHKYGRSCVISDQCVKTMTLRGLTEYGLTHQILWTMVAEKAGCLQEMKKVIQDQGFPDVETLQLEFCTNNYYEMLAVVHIYMKGVIRNEYQDLFLEQQFVCPNIGFYEHLTHDYLQQVLSWQMESGCYGDSARGKKKKKKYKHAEDQFNRTEYQLINANMADKSHKLLYNNQKNVVKMNAALPNGMRAKKLNGNQSNYQSKKSRLNNAQKVNPLIFHQKAQAARVKPLPGNTGNISKQHPLKQSDMENTVSKVQRSMAVGNGFNQPNQDQPLKVANNLNFKLNQLQVNIPKALIGRTAGRQLSYVQSRGPQRKLLVEKSMEGGCFAHKTAVGAGALVMYLRYLIDPGPLDLNSSHRVLPESSRSLLEKAEASLGDSQKVKKEGLIPVKQKLNAEDLALNQMAPALEDREGDDGFGDGGDAGEQSEEYEGDEDEDEEEDGDEGVDDEAYEDKDMYPDKEENIRDRKIVHFGAERKDELNDVERFGKDDAGGLVDNLDMDQPLKGDNPQGNADDAEYTYYDEPEKEEKSVQQSNFKKDTHVVKSHHRNKSHNPHESRRLVRDPKGQDPVGKTMFIVFSVCFLFLFFLMYRFIKKRRIHIRYHPRTIFSL